MEVTKFKKNIEFDKAIAIFMGWQIDDSFPDKGRVWRSPEKDIEMDTTFKFSIDLNKLMSVFEAVNKIEGITASIIPGRCSIHYKYELDYEELYHESSQSLLEALYKCLGAFILEYNKSLTK